MTIKKITIPSNIHIPISLICYLACLFFNSFYTAKGLETRFDAYFLLLLGWLGPLGGYFSWYANPLFLFALIFRRKLFISSILSVIGLMLALSFLLHSEMMVDERPGYSKIIAYDWGYSLWIISFLVLSIGQILRLKSYTKEKVNFFSCCGLLFSLLIYIFYCLFSSNSVYSINKIRKIAFKEICLQAKGEEIFKTVQPPESIFIESNWGIDWYKTSSGYLQMGYGVIGDSLTNSGFVKFFETQEENNIIKHTINGRTTTKTSQFESDYIVTTDSIPSSQKQYYDYGIIGRIITIKNKKDNSIIAQYSYGLDQVNRRTCPASIKNFSPSSFIIKALNMKRQYKSIYDDNNK